MVPQTPSSKRAFANEAARGVRFTPRYDFRHILVVVLWGDPRTLRSVAAAIRFLAGEGIEVSMQPTTDRDTFLRVLADAAHALPVLDPFAGGFDIMGDMELVRRATPSSHSVILADFCHHPAQAILEAHGASGVHRVFTLGVDDRPSSVGRAMMRAIGLDGLIREVEQLLVDAPLELRMAALWAVRNSHRALSVKQLSREVGVSARTMTRWLARERTFTPKELLRWSRVLRAAQMAANTEASWSTIANVLSFSTPGALSRQFKRVVGVRPTDLPRGELLESTFTVFRRHLEGPGH